MSGRQQEHAASNVTGVESSSSMSDPLTTRLGNKPFSFCFFAQIARTVSGTLMDIKESLGRVCRRSAAELSIDRLLYTRPPRVCDHDESLHWMRPTVDRQSGRWSSRKYTPQLRPDDHQNYLNFECFASCLRTHNLYAQYFLCNMHACDAVLVFGREEFKRFQHDEHLRTLDLGKLGSLLSYLDAGHLELLDTDAFRTVDISKTADSQLCSLAAALRMDIWTTVNPVQEAGPEQSTASYDSVVELCVDMGLIAHTRSDRLTGVVELNDYLAAEADRLRGHTLIIHQYEKGETGRKHAVVMRYKPAQGPADQARWLLIDYQLPGLMHQEVPFPLRFTPYIDCTLYDSFVVDSIHILV